MRSTNWSARGTLLASVVIIGLSFIVGLVVVVSLWLLIQALGFSTSLWAMLEALATAGAAALVLGASVVAYRELAEISSSRHLEVADRLFHEMNSAENIAARRWIYQHLPADPEEGIRSLTPEGQDAIKRVLNSLDRVAFLTQPGWIPEKLVMPWMSIMVVKAWDKLAPYVYHERERRHEPDYYRYAEEVSRRCQAWRQEHEPDATITWMKDAL